MSDLAARIEEVLARLPPHEQALVRANLARYITQQQAIKRYPTPGHLSQLHRPSFKQTPMLDKLDEAIMMAQRGEATRIIVNTPPQEGKTSRLQDGCAWLMLKDPTLRIAFASYEQSIAAQSSLEIRRIIETHGGGYRGQTQALGHVDVLGLQLDPERAQQTNWSLADVPGKKKVRPGSVVAVGIGSSLTGRPVDVMVIDDPIKDAKQADSDTWRKAVKDWYRSVVLTRLPPRSIVIVVQTRWHEDDLTGWLLAEDAKEKFPQWLHLNIPAQAGEDDILGRQPGEFLPSTRGRSTKDWEQKRKDVGTRWWFAMYQGEPGDPEGGDFKREWFAKYRVAEAPTLGYVMTVIDPADNTGDGDEAGIITGGLDSKGEVYVLEDNSGHYTVGGWVRAGLYAMIRNKASRLGYEKSLSGLQRSIKAEWTIIRKQARELARAQSAWSTFDDEDWPEEINMLAMQDAETELRDEDDDPDVLFARAQQLREMWPHVPAILRMPKVGPPIKGIRAVGSKSLRASLVSPHYEGGRVHHVGLLAKLENQMSTWLPSQDSPDRMDAVVHLVAELMALSTASKVEKAKTPPGARPVDQRQRQMPQILRTTRYNR